MFSAWLWWQIPLRQLLTKQHEFSAWYFHAYSQHLVHNFVPHWPAFTAMTLQVSLFQVIVLVHQTWRSIWLPNLPVYKSLYLAWLHILHVSTSSCILCDCIFLKSINNFILCDCIFFKSINHWTLSDYLLFMFINQCILSDYLFFMFINQCTLFYYLFFMSLNQCILSDCLFFICTNKFVYYNILRNILWTTENTLTIFTN